MEGIICYCPICQGQLLFEDLKVLNPTRSSQPLITTTLYCPHCEMLVEPVVAAVAILDHSNPAFRGDIPRYAGRLRSSGSNAGGSQRGDLSDEGASQWRVDPEEEERNTWQPKH